MPTPPNLWRHLTDDWERVASGREARAAALRWGELDGDLAGFPSPDAVVRACRSARSPRANRLLRALLRRAAADPLAARTALQAVLPALVSLADHHGRAASFPGACWQDPGHLEAELVAVACECIATAAADPPAFPSVFVRDRCRDHLRCAEWRHAHRTSGRVPWDEALEPVAGAEVSVVERLTGALVEALGEGTLSLEQAGVIYTTRVLGHPTGELARHLGRDERAVRKQRNRAERKLAEVA